MLRHLHVALVFNLKTEAEEDPNDGETDSRRGSDPLVAAGSPAKLLGTRNDTYAEWDTRETIEAVKAALEEYHRVTLIEANEEAFELLRATRPDLVFNMAEGLRGASREAQVPSVLEMLGIPYTGSDPVTLSICLDKSRAKEILSYYRVPTAPFVVIRNPEEVASLRFPVPAIVKPLHEGSSKGIYNSSVVRTPEELVARVNAVLTNYEQPALVEKFLAGREFTVALLGNVPDVRVLPIIETKFDALPRGVHPIYSYEAKWIWDQAENPIDVHECPARVSTELRKTIEETCLRAFTVLGCRDWCRIDVRLDEAGVPHVLELNPLPGILPDPEDHSCFPLAARIGGLPYNALLNEVVRIATKRYGMV